MDWYPLLNSLRIAAVSTMAVFFLGILAAYYIAKLPRLLKGVLDVVLTLPLVLPPTCLLYTSRSPVTTIAFSRQSRMICCGKSPR